MDKFRKDGYRSEELKLYWNAKQLENLCPKEGEQPQIDPPHDSSGKDCIENVCPKEGEQSQIDPPHDPSDKDCIKNLRQYPVSKRNHAGEISYVNKGIEKAVFDVPADAQVIVLNFAVIF